MGGGPGTQGQRAGCIAYGWRSSASSCADRLVLQPAIPEDWPGYVLTFRFGQTEYRVEVTNGGERSNEETLLIDDGGSHIIRINAGASAGYEQPRGKADKGMING